MTVASPPQTACRRCRAPLDAADNYCRRCGTPTGQQPAWWENPWFVLSMLFLVLGPLAIPLLWRSRRFTPAWKIVLTILVLVLTLFLVWRIWIAVQQVLAAFSVDAHGNSLKFGI